MAPASSKSTFQLRRSWAARSLAFRSRRRRCASSVPHRDLAPARRADPACRLDPLFARPSPRSARYRRNVGLTRKAKDLAAQLRRNWNVDFDDAGAIGRRYRRQDEIGTPFCITVDFDTIDDQAVTIRERDSMAQERIALDKVESYLAARLIGA